MSEFSDRPFVAGVLTGLRAFRVDQLGRLTGVTHKDVWTPGENVALCHKGEYPSPFAQQAAQMTAQLTALTLQIEQHQARAYGRRGQKVPSIPKIPTPREKAAEVVKVHRLAGITCECGFYAYFDGGNDYLGGDSSGGYITVTMFGGTPDTAPRVGAIVNAWGAATVGTRGFRAEKAEVVALIVPDGTRARHEVAFSKARRNYPDVQVFDTEKDAVRAFPLTDPAPYSPETDPDFWTRSAS